MRVEDHRPPEDNNIPVFANFDFPLEVKFKLDLPRGFQQGVNGSLLVAGGTREGDGPTVVNHINVTPKIMSPPPPWYTVPSRMQHSGVRERGGQTRVVT